MVMLIMCCLYFKGLKWLKTDIFMSFKQYILLKYLNCHMIDHNIFYKGFIYCKAILVIALLLKTSPNKNHIITGK